MGIRATKSTLIRNPRMAEILLEASGTAPLLSVGNCLPHSIGRHFMQNTPNWAIVERFAPPTLFPPPVLVAIWCLLVYGVRVSELLNAKVENINLDDAVTLAGTKKSNERTIYIPGITAWATSLDTLYLDAFIFGFSYNQLYGYCRRAGLGFLLPQHKNVTRTHLGRHIVADKARKSGGDAAVTAALGHKSNKTQLYYGIETKGSLPPMG